MCFPLKTSCSLSSIALTTLRIAKARDDRAFMNNEDPIDSQHVNVIVNIL
jgi:hypothetical protein